jgi:peroxiredoxin
MMPAVGDSAPDFSLPSNQGEIRLSDLASRQRVLLAFYQEDNTPTCSSEVATLKEAYPLLEEAGVAVVAVSADSLESHASFSERLGGLPFPLAADTELMAATRYGVVDDTGKRSLRAVFIIDKGGKIIHAIPWFNPSNFGQMEEIFQALGIE